MARYGRRSRERLKKGSLDALLACYLTLKGPDGLKLVNEQFLGNPEADFKNLYSALMALRFHGDETDVLPREDLLASMRLALDHHDFADQVVRDLARWDDWEVLPRLVDMFKISPVDDWVREPVASYLLVAAEQPGEVGDDARGAIRELEELDPQTFVRARSFAAFGGSAGRVAAASAAAANVPASTSAIATDAATEVDSPAVVSSVAEEPLAENNDETPANPDNPDDVATVVQTPAQDLGDSDRADSEGVNPPRAVALIGVPLLAALVLFAVFAALLRSGDSRPPADVQ